MKFRIVLAIGVVASVMASANAAIASCRVPSLADFKLTGWHVEEPHFYENEKYGFAVPYFASHAKATLFVYNYAIPNPQLSDVKAQFQQSVREIQYVTKEYRQTWELSQPQGIVPDKLKSIVFIDFAAFMTLSDNNNSELTVVALGLTDGCFYKLRYTQRLTTLDPFFFKNGLNEFQHLAEKIDLTVRENELVGMK